jgi:nitrite reductase/ring-hydroxylating ferredoxin subunit
MNAQEVTTRLERLSLLDGPAAAVGSAVRGALGPGAVKDALSGTRFGHAIHPPLTGTVIGTWTSALLLDLTGGEGGDRLVAAGVVCAIPTALTGASEWADAEAADSGVRRVGALHALANVTALGLQVGSLAARRRGARGRGVALSVLAGGVLAVSGYLGGHLTLRKGIGVDQTTFDPGADEWTVAMLSADLGASPASVVVGETPVLVVRTAEGIRALHDRCSHRGCSLSEGTVDGGVVQCACHGSRFDLADGSVVRGPATAPQPACAVREREGSIEVRRVSA